MYPMPECYRCFIKHAKSVLKLLDYEKSYSSLAMNVAETIANGSLNLPPPVITGHFHRKLKESSKTGDFYLAVKKDSNERAMKILPVIEEIISKSENPLKTAITASISGNAVDFGVRNVEELKNWENEIFSLIKNTFFDDRVIDDFVSDISSAKKILYLADNTGEIVFDRILLQMLPLDKITLAVRGKPTLNDALIEDAQFAGITKIVRTIDNGSDIPGTWLPEVSEDFKNEFESADLIISKGMGNYETLCESDRPIYFLFMVKCSPVAKMTNRKKGELTIFKNPKCLNYKA